MNEPKQLWLLAGGNGSGKSTFYKLFLAPLNIKFINADLIAKLLNPDNPESISYGAASLAEKERNKLLTEGISFCLETVFSHPSKIDFTAKAKGLGYEIILVYIHLDNPQLNEARVQQRITTGGHSVPAEKIHSRIPRTMRNTAKALPLIDEARFLDNSSRKNPFQQVALIKLGRIEWQSDPCPDWAIQMLPSIT
ncbi:MAG: AAA family ATPase [Desulfobacteraceae bacterium]|nr:AAA family ATPase [Desulfobacteraceae bacterium]